MVISFLENTTFDELNSAYESEYYVLLWEQISQNEIRIISTGRVDFKTNRIREYLVVKLGESYPGGYSTFGHFLSMGGQSPDYVDELIGLIDKKIELSDFNEGFYGDTDEYNEIAPRDGFSFLVRVFGTANTKEVKLRTKQEYVLTEEQKKKINHSHVNYINFNYIDLLVELVSDTHPECLI